MSEMTCKMILQKSPDRLTSSADLDRYHASIYCMLLWLTILISVKLW